MAKSESYHLDCCSAECDWLDANPDQPCWGAVEGMGDDWDEETGDEYRTHACQGHQPCVEGNPYLTEPKAVE
jgi:hypothetical protein